MTGCSSVVSTFICNNIYIEIKTNVIKQLSYIWKLLDYPVPGVRSAEQVDEYNVLLGNVMLLEHLDRLAHLVTGPEDCVLSLAIKINTNDQPHDGVKQQHLPARDVVRKLGEDHVSLVCLGVAVHQHLADPHGPAALLQRLLHGLARPHDGHSTVALLVFEPRVVASRGGYDLQGTSLGLHIFNFFSDQPHSLDTEAD